MTPAARVSAAIDILDAVLNGEAAERRLTTWARQNRYAGSKDRAAIRDLVFEALRKLQSFAALGGWAADWPPTGRAVMIGSVRASGADVEHIFSDQRFAPKPLKASERNTGQVSQAHKWNLPNWLQDKFRDVFAEHAFEQAVALSQRAPVTLRVNLAKTSPARLRQQLASEGFETRDNPVSETALTLMVPGRGLMNSPSYLAGLFEFQDAASQAVVDELPLRTRMNVLDYCAGGGGKTLAMAARLGGPVYAHDANVGRMADIPKRAQRAGATVHVLETLNSEQHSSFDLVLLDVPCSGSGSWRRAPDEKWRITQDKLHKINDVQRKILARAHEFVAENGVLAYATCSVLRDENEAQIQWFLSEFPNWRQTSNARWKVTDDGDGFFISLLKRV